MLRQSARLSSVATKSWWASSTKKDRKLLLGRHVDIRIDTVDIDSGLSLGEVVSNNSNRASGDAVKDPIGSKAFVPFAPVGLTLRCRISNTLPKSKAVKAFMVGSGMTRLEGALPQAAAIPQCPHYGVCGGCVFQSTASDVQYAAKVRWVDAQYRAAFRNAVWEPMRSVLEAGRPASQQYRYRNRVAFSLGSGEWNASGPAAAVSPSGANGLRQVYVGFNPSRHASSGSKPSVSDSSDLVEADAPGPTLQPNEDAVTLTSAEALCEAASAQAPQPARSGIWTKRVVIRECALMAEGHEQVLVAVRAAIDAWQASPRSAELARIEETLEEVVIRTGNAPVLPGEAASIRGLSHDSDAASSGTVFQLVLRWASVSDVDAFRPFVDAFVLPRLQTLLSAGGVIPAQPAGEMRSAAATFLQPPVRLVSVVGLSFPTSIPRAMRKQWEAGERDGTLGCSAQEAAIRYLQGHSVVYAGCERLAKVYRLQPDARTLRLHVSPRAFVQPSDEGGVAIMGALADVVRDVRVDMQTAASDSGSPELPLTADGRAGPGSLSPLVAWDLFCGTGALGLSLAVRGLVDRLVGIELDSSAVRDAAANAATNGVPAHKAAFRAVNLDTGISGLLLDTVQPAGGSAAPATDDPAAGALPRPDLVIVDPPRAGLHPKLLGELRDALRPRYFVYISCNPATQARDIAALCGHAVAPRGAKTGKAQAQVQARAGEGSDDPALTSESEPSAGCYELLRLVPVDQYAQTPHIECVALLRLRMRGAVGLL